MRIWSTVVVVGLIAAPVGAQQQDVNDAAAALDPSAKLSNARSANGQNLVDIGLPNGLQATLAIDATTKLPARVVTMSDNTVLGDVAVETTFSDYQTVGGLKLPARLTTKTD